MASACPGLPRRPAEGPGCRSAMIGRPKRSFGASGAWLYDILQCGIPKLALLFSSIVRPFRWPITVTDNPCRLARLIHCRIVFKATVAMQFHRIIKIGQIVGDDRSLLLPDESVVPSRCVDSPRPRQAKEWKPPTRDGRPRPARFVMQNQQRAQCVFHHFALDNQVETRVW